jgi:hypothetical protein
MASQITGKAIRSAVYGIQVVRATGNLPQSTNAAIFTVSNKVLVTSLVGVVTTAIQAQANNFNLTTNSTTGNITTNLCAVLDINGLAAGNLIGIDGVRANAMVTGSNIPQPNEVCVTAGTIRAVAAASSTGQIQWTLTYIPVDDGATVTAA